MKQKRPVVAAMALFLAGLSWSAPSTLKEAMTLGTEMAPAYCNIILLERELVSLIRESGQPQSKFLSRPADDPDPHAQRVIQITRQLQETAKSLQADSRRMSELAADFTPDEKAQFDHGFRLLISNCSRR